MLPSTNSKSNFRFERIAIFLILLLAFLLRFWGISFGLPSTYHADEPIIVNHALAYGTFDFHPHFFRVPPFSSYLLFIVYGGYFLFGKIFGFFPSVKYFEYFFYENPTSFYLLGRLFLGVIPGTLSVYLLYQFVRNHFSKNVAFLSALLFAVCFLPVRDSHYIYCDIPLMVALIIAWKILWKVMDQPQNKVLHFWFGALAGICCAIKYNGGAIILPYFFVSFYLAQPCSKIFISWIFMFAGMFLFYTLLNPFSFLDFHFFIKEIIAESYAHKEGVPWAHHYVYSLKEGLGPPLWICSSLAMVVSFFKKNLKLNALGFFTASYYLILIYGGQSYERYVLPILPSALIITADAFEDLRKKSRKLKSLWLLVLTLLILPSLFQSIRFDQVISEKDTRTLAKEWIEKNISYGTSIAFNHHFFAPRLNHSPEQLKEKENKIRQNEGDSATRLRKIVFLQKSIQDKKLPFYELNFLTENSSGEDKFTFSGPFLPYAIKSIEDKKISYVVVSYLNDQDPHEAFKKELAQKAVLEATFSPYHDPSIKMPVDSQILTGGPFSWKDLWARSRNGYTIEIYRLKSGT